MKIKKMLCSLMSAVILASGALFTVPQIADVGIAAEAAGDAIKLDRTSMALGKGEKMSINAVTKSKSRISWSSNKSNIVSVDSSGIVYGRQNGTAVITAKLSSGQTSKCTVTVKNVPSKVTLTKGVLTLGVGESYTVGSGVNDGAASANRTYRTSNSRVVQMNNTKWTGKFTAKQTGVAYVTVRTYNGKESTCKVTVKAAPTKVSLSRGLINMTIGQSASLNAIIPSNAGCAKRTFRSSNLKVVRMMKTNWICTFMAVKVGTAYVTVRTYNGKEASCKIVVKEPLWVNAYRQKLTEMENFMIREGYSTNLLKFCLFDIDKNGIPELFISPTDFVTLWSTWAYTMSGNKVVSVGRDEYSLTMLGGGYGSGDICPELHLIRTFGFSQGLASDHYTIINNGKITNQYSHVYTFYESRSEDEDKNVDKYIINGKRVTKEKFEEATKNFDDQYYINVRDFGRSDVGNNYRQTVDDQLHIMQMGPGALPK